MTLFNCAEATETSKKGAQLRRGYFGIDTLRNLVPSQADALDGKALWLCDNCGRVHGEKCSQVAHNCTLARVVPVSISPILTPGKKSVKEWREHAKVCKQMRLLNPRSRNNGTLCPSMRARRLKQVKEALSSTMKFAKKVACELDLSLPKLMRVCKYGVLSLTPAEQVKLIGSKAKALLKKKAVKDERLYINRGDDGLSTARCARLPNPTPF